MLQSVTLLNVTLLNEYFSRFLICGNGIKSCKALQMNMRALATEMFLVIQGSYDDIANDIFVKRPGNHYSLHYLNDFQIPS